MGGFWHLSQLKFEEISPKILRMQILRKLAPSCPQLLAPLAPLGIKKFFGRLLASITPQVRRKITKNTKNPDSHKTSPPHPPPPHTLYPPPPPPLAPLGINFWEVSGIYHSSRLKKYHQN